MVTNSEEESEKACPDAEHPGASTIPDEAPHSSIVDTSVSSTNLHISNLPAITMSSEVSKDTPETSPSTETFESKKTSGGLEENERTESSPEEGLKVFSTNENPVSGLEATSLCAAAEATLLSESTFKGNKQSSDTKESNLLAGPMDATGVTNDVFQLDEINQKKDDVQIQVVSPTSTARRQNVLLGWDVLKSWSLMGFLAAFILWAAIFFPLLHNGIV